MPFAPQLSLWLIQAGALQDTIVAKTMPAERSLFDYTSGTLQIIVLVLAVVVLAALAYVLIALKKGLDSVKGTVDKLYSDTKPLITQASQVAEDAREVVAMLRTDVERVTHAAGMLTNQLLDVADATERRMDDVNAVLDVVQGELEETVLSTTAALRGVRLGGRALAGALTGGGGKPSRRERMKARINDARSEVRGERVNERTHDDEFDNEFEEEVPRVRDRHSRRQRDAGD